jgi:hypothetical protein
MLRRAALLVAGLTVLAGCSSSDSDGGPDAAPPAPSSAGPSSAGPATCTPSTVDNGEVEGTSTDGVSFFALLQGVPSDMTPDGSGIRARREIKIVVRVGGSGDLAVSAEGPAGQRVEPAWGPEAHGGSNFDRPGDEWGVGLRFPSPGCWRVTVTRSETGSAQLAVRVV